MENDERIMKVNKQLEIIAGATESIGELMQEVPKRRIRGIGGLSVARVDIDELESYVTIHSGPSRGGLYLTVKFNQPEKGYHLSISNMGAQTQ